MKKNVQFVAVAAFTFVICWFGFSELVVAIPQFSGGFPVSNTYTYGRRTDQFAINITDSLLNTSSVTHRIRAYEPGTIWVNTSSTCSNVGSYWSCSNVVESVAGLASDGGRLIFYFDAGDTNGNYNSSSNYFVTVDRSGPTFTFSGVANNSHVAGTASIRAAITDTYSGLNTSAVFSFYGNATWNSSETAMTSDGQYYVANWLTTGLSDNSVWNFFVKAKDNVGNERTERLNLTTDNTVPYAIDIKSPTLNQTIGDSATFRIVANDTHSGIDNTSARYFLSSYTFDMSCTSFNNGLDAECTHTFTPPSTGLPDGLYTVYFNVSDRAGNKFQNSTTIKKDTTAPVITFVTPSSGSYISATTTINATIADPGAGTTVSSVKIKINNATYTSDLYNMTCTGTIYNYQCTYALNTKLFIDGSYTITIQATDGLSHSSTATVNVAIDNKRSSFTLHAPESFMRGKYRLNLSIYDEYGLTASSVLYGIFTASGSMTCMPIGSNANLSCILTFDSTTLADGPYNLTFYVMNGLGKNNSAAYARSIDNNAPVVSSVVIKPIISKTPTTFSTTVTVIEMGSSVAYVEARVIEPGGTFYNINMTSMGSNVWSLAYSGSKQGKYTLNLTTADANGNNATTTSGLFYIGSINCGNGVCDSEENYCFCSSDCGPPNCAVDEEVSCSSGIPKCIKKSVTATTTTSITTGVADGEQKIDFWSKTFGDVGKTVSGNLLWVIIGVVIVCVVVFLLWPVKAKP